jgi:Fic family protein
MELAILNSLRSTLLERMSLTEIPEDIWKRSSALNTWGTNAIEGSTITWEDARKILLEDLSVKNKPIRDILETFQHEKAFRNLLERQEFPITIMTILELHEEVFRGIFPDAGQWRNINVRIRGADFNPPRMEKVVSAMEIMIKEYHERDKIGVAIFDLAAWFHFDFERIHPFSDGNGRVGRLLLNLHFLKHNWPPIHFLPINREEYLDGLNKAARGDLHHLSGLFMKLMGSSLLDLLDSVGTEADELLDLKKAAEVSPYGEKYLSLRCGQGEMPGILRGNRWRTSRRAIDLYIMEKGRIRS